MSDWQPIETAPKDGTKVVIAYHDGDRWLFYTDYWRKYLPGFGEGWGAPVWPTHWMPLPLPPVPEGETR